MKIFKRILLLSFLPALFSCENEVEINAEFEEVTSVVGLLSVNADTQFVRISRTFLDDEQNAIQLAGQPERIYYDSLNVKLINDETKDEIILQKTLVRKDDGLFSNEMNEVYFTTAPINARVRYNLEVTKPDGSITTGTTRVIDSVLITNPRRSVNSPIAFVNFRQEVQSFEFEFTTPIDQPGSGANAVGEFEAEMRFSYTEIIANDSTVKTIAIPIAGFTNSSLTGNREFKFDFQGSRFFEIFEQEIPASVNAPTRVILDGAFQVEVNAADAQYTLYRDVNGPIDGLSQNRPEFPNIQNGIGIFASRAKTLRKINMDGETKNYIERIYGNKVDNLSKFRGFRDPN